MFSQACVKNSVHWGGSDTPSQRQTPPQADTLLSPTRGRHPYWQTPPPCSRCSQEFCPLGDGVWQTPRRPEADTPPTRQTPPPDQRQTLPLGRHHLPVLDVVTLLVFTQTSEWMKITLREPVAMAEWVACQTAEQEVGGSNPSIPPLLKHACGEGESQRMYITYASAKYK